MALCTFHGTHEASYWPLRASRCSVINHRTGGGVISLPRTQRQVLVLDRQANLVDSIKLPQEDAPYDARLSGTLSLEWDAAGDVLAMLPRNSASIRLWQVGTKEAATVDTGLKVGATTVPTTCTRPVPCRVRA